LVEGLIAFRQMYRGQLWIEVMLVRGLNNTEQALRDIVTLMRQIQPDQIHINLPTRPPAEPWVQPPDDEGLMRATALLGHTAHVVQPIEGTFDLGHNGHLTDAIVGIITRHPLREEELRQALAKWSPGQVEEALAELVASGRAQVIERYGTRFWSAAGSRYLDDSA
jgi:wyosine [tRNA(Phe)-imidazoG37] synthetase (radical SAM superfamily)